MEEVAAPSAAEEQKDIFGESLPPGLSLGAEPAGDAPPAPGP